MSRRLLTLSFVLLTGACSTLGPTGRPPRDYDLGTPPTQTDALVGSAFSLTRVGASETLDSTDMLYRLLYDDPNRLSGYTENRWRVPPAQLATARLARATGLPIQGGASSRTPKSRCVIGGHLFAFEQRFHASASAEAALEWTFHVDDAVSRRRLGVKRVIKTVPMPSPNAAGGAKALSVAVDEAVSDALVWITTEIMPKNHQCE